MNEEEFAWPKPQIAELEAQLAVEVARLNAATTYGSGSPGSGYWKTRHELQRKLTGLRAVRDELVNSKA